MTVLERLDAVVEAFARRVLGDAIDKAREQRGAFQAPPAPDAPPRAPARRRRARKGAIMGRVVEKD